MLTRISKVLLLVALLAAFVASSAPAFATPDCLCFSLKKNGNGEGCHFNKTTSQCVNTSCAGFCSGRF